MVVSGHRQDPTTQQLLDRNGDAVDRNSGSDGDPSRVAVERAMCDEPEHGANILMQAHRRELLVVQCKPPSETRRHCRREPMPVSCES
jgi:hypothetical protein